MKNTTNQLWGELRSIFANSISEEELCVEVNNVFRRWQTGTSDYDAAVSYLLRARPGWQPRQVVPPPNILLVRWMDGELGSLLEALCSQWTSSRRPMFQPHDYLASQTYFRRYQDDYSALQIGTFDSDAAQPLFNYLEPLGAPLDDQSGILSGMYISQYVPLSLWYPDIGYLVRSWDAILSLSEVALLPRSDKRWDVTLYMFDFSQFTIDIHFQDDQEEVDLLELFEAAVQLQTMVPLACIDLLELAMDDQLAQEEGVANEGAERFRNLWQNYLLLRTGAVEVPSCLGGW